MPMKTPRLSFHAQHSIPLGKQEGISQAARIQPEMNQGQHILSFFLLFSPYGMGSFLTSRGQGLPAQPLSVALGRREAPGESSAALRWHSGARGGFKSERYSIYESTAQRDVATACLGTALSFLRGEKGSLLHSVSQGLWGSQLGSHKQQQSLSWGGLHNPAGQGEEVTVSVSPSRLEKGQQVTRRM